VSISVADLSVRCGLTQAETFKALHALNYPAKFPYSTVDQTVASSLITQYANQLAPSVRRRWIGKTCDWTGRATIAGGLIFAATLSLFPQWTTVAEFHGSRPIRRAAGRSFLWIEPEPVLPRGLDSTNTLTLVTELNYSRMLAETLPSAWLIALGIGVRRFRAVGFRPV
jgi:hypothetical protein